MQSITLLVSVLFLLVATSVAVGQTPAVQEYPAVGNSATQAATSRDSICLPVCVKQDTKVGD